jgi:GntR family transcriptional regulator
MFINEGARKLLLAGERQKFLAEEWPRITEAIERLGLTPEELWEAARKNGQASSAKQEER